MAIPRKPKSQASAATPNPAMTSAPEALLPVNPPAPSELASALAADLESAVSVASEPVAMPSTPMPAVEAVVEKVAESTAAASDYQATLKQGAEKAMSDMQAFQEKIRQAAEQSLEQTRAAYQKAKTAAEEATSSLETSYAAATRGFTEFNQKTLGAMKAHADATFDHMKAVLAVTSVSEMVELQTEHLRKRIEAVNEQVKDLTSVAQRVATDTTEPLKATFTKRFAA